MRRQLLTAGIIIVMLGLGGVSGATDSNTIDANNLQTLDDYLAFASLNNAELKAKFEEYKAALEQIPQAKSLDDPKFTYKIEEFSGGNRPDMQKYGIEQMFPWFGTLKVKGDMASAESKAAYKEYEAVKLQVYQQVKDAFYEYLYLKEAIAIAEENLELLKHFESIARTNYQTSMANHPDVIRAQIELAELDNVLISLRELKQPMTALLNARLNRPQTLPLPWPQKPPMANTSIDQTKLIELIINNNPHLAGMNWQIEAARSNVQLAKKKFYPNIGVGFEYVERAEIPARGKSPLTLMFSMNIPLWQDNYKAGERQAKANLNKSIQQKIDSTNKTISETMEVLYDYQDSQRKISLYGEVLIPKTEELLHASESAYGSGGIDFLSLIDAQRTLLKYQLDYNRALTDNQQKLAELEMLAGTELSSK
jgi:cobalt-zinc-cadmium efflux system outer membrane protein